MFACPSAYLFGPVDNSAVAAAVVAAVSGYIAAAAVGLAAANSGGAPLGSAVAADLADPSTPVVESVSSATTSVDAP